MLRNPRDPREAREALLSVLETSGTLAGIGIGLVGFINVSWGGLAATWRTCGFIDVLFLASMTLMVVAGFIVVCALF